MKEQSVSLLFLSGDPGDARLLQRLLEESGGSQVQVASAGSVDDVLAQVAAGPCDLIFLGLKWPVGGWEKILGELRSECPKIPVAVWVKVGEEREALLALRQGAHGFMFADGFDQAAMAKVIGDAIERAQRESILVSERVLQNEKMAALGRIASGVAHELNNPLAVIAGFAQVMEKRIAKDDPLRPAVDSVGRESNRCKVLVQELLSFSRAGGRQKQKADINLMLGGVVSLIEAEAKTRDISVVRELSPGLPEIYLNANHIQQVVFNLCSNAMDAMPKGGTLTVTTEKIQKAGGDCVQIRVQDTGEGVPPEIQKKIFDPFFTTKPSGKGTGLGLYLVREIVSEHEGTVELESRPGAGSSFCVVLPVAAASAAGAGRRKRVLIVEDELDVKRSIGRYLQQCGFEILFAGDGAEAAKVMEEQDPDLVVLDVYLPEVDGFQICENIRSSDKLKHIRILAITGINARTTRRKILESGADDFLGKPFNLNDFRGKVESLLAS